MTTQVLWLSLWTTRVLGNQLAKAIKEAGIEFDFNNALEP